MFIDFLTLMLINMAAGLFVLACYVFSASDTLGKPHWAPAFGIVGLVAAVCGFYLVFIFPLPGPFNLLFGESSVLLGVLFLAAAWSLARAWSLVPLSFYALFAGAMAVISGVACFYYKLTLQPPMTAAGFILTGVGGMLIAPVLWCKALRWLKWPAGFALLIASGLWAFTGFYACWMHVTHYEKLAPLIMHRPTP